MNRQPPYSSRVFFCKNKTSVSRVKCAKSWKRYVHNIFTLHAKALGCIYLKSLEDIQVMAKKEARCSWYPKLGKTLTVGAEKQESDHGVPIFDKLCPQKSRRSARQ